MTTLSHRGDVTSNSAKDFPAIQTSETARYFLLNLVHANVLFPLVICEGDLKIIHKA